MLAARAEDVGSSLTSVLAFKNSETFEILGVPEDKGWKMAACIPMGYPTGTWGSPSVIPFTRWRTAIRAMTSAS